MRGKLDTPMLKILTFALLGLIAAGVALRALNPLPPLEPRQTSRALTDTAETPLSRGVQRLRAVHPELSGLRMLDRGRTAFAARVLLAGAAVSSLDVQYYVWRDDLSGTLLLQEMRKAAERIPARAYEVRLAPDGSLVWIERTAGGDVRHDIEPERTRLQGWTVALLAKLPIGWLL